MLCTSVGRKKVETHHPTIPDMGGSQNGSFEVIIWETKFECKIVKMVDPISRVRFEVCGKEDYQR